MPEKAVIKPESGEDIVVCYNPTQYSLDQGNQIAEVGVPGLGAPILQYVRGNGRTLTMDLFFDTYEEQRDVRDLTRQVYALLDVDSRLRRPKSFQFVWGGETACRWVLERVGGRFTMFLANGTPVRATLSVVFKEFADVAVTVSKVETAAAEHTRTYVVKRGDTLSGIAAAQYGDASKWRGIAAANRITNPRTLQPGTPLAIPARP
ncbi:MAG TPA: LysM peptidoglycan-binding domain-containing protein [Longimicrobiaceae bacterium]|jgi:LysM repeat protein